MFDTLGWGEIGVLIVLALFVIAGRSAVGEITRACLDLPVRRS